MTDAWSERDDAIWRTCAIVSDLLGGRLAPRPIIPATFALTINPPHERLLAQGKYQASLLVAGDGTYIRKSGWAVGFGPVGIALAGATLGAQVVGNKRRKSRAIRDLQPRWKAVDQGTLHIGTEGFYLQGPGGLRSWPWHSVLEADLIGSTGVFAFRGASSENQELWRLTTVWAELLFVLWALRMNRHHPRIVGANWLPPDHDARFRAHGYDWADAAEAVRRSITRATPESGQRPSPSIATPRPTPPAVVSARSAHPPNRPPSRDPGLETTPPPRPPAGPRASEAAPGSTPPPADVLTAAATSRPSRSARPSRALGCLGVVFVLMVLGGIVGAIVGDESADDDSPTSARVPILIGMDLQQAQDELQSAGFYNLSSEDALPGEDRFQIDDSNWFVVGQTPDPCTTVDTDTEVTLRVLKDDEDPTVVGATVEPAPDSCPSAAADAPSLIATAQFVATRLAFTEGPEDRSDRTAEFVNPGIQTGWASGTTASGIVDFELYQTTEARELAEIAVSIENDESQLGNTWASCKNVLVVLQAYLDPAQAIEDAVLVQQALDESIGPC